jgi:hypothetical protein
MISLVSPEIATLGTFKQGACVDLKQTCADCTYVNIVSVMLPNSSQALGLTAMTQTGTLFTYDFCGTSLIGTYIVNMEGDVGGTSTVVAYDFKVNPTGKEFDTSYAITQGVIILLIFGVTILFLIFAKLTEVGGVKLFFNVVSYIVMMIAVGMGYMLLQNIDLASNISNTMNGLVFVVGIVFIIIMFYIMINQTRQALALMRAKKGYGSGFDNPPTF